MFEQVNQTIAEALASHTDLPLSEIGPLLEQPKNKEFGDIAFPCFILAKALKKSPKDCASDLSSKLELPEGVEEVTPVGPFLNFRYSRSPIFKHAITKVLDGRIVDNVGKERVVLEYSSPNIAKPYHVGHLRTTLIGNSLDRVYRSLGYSVVTVDHLGDWGTQFGFVWVGCELWGKPENPTVKALVDLYRKATSLREKQEEKPEELTEEEKTFPPVNEKARAFFLDLEAGKEYAHEFWSWCREISLDYLKKTDARLGVKFDHYIGESFYADKLDDVKQDIEKAGILKNSEGALGVDLGEELGFARISTEDGRSLYLTRDLATAKYRAQEFKFDKAVYVVGAPQALHFKQLIGILKKLKVPYADNITHASFGHVRGMKTRGGGSFIELNEFIDEASERALTAYREQVGKRPEGLDENKVAEAVGKAAIIFSTLSKTRVKDVEFSWEHALAFQGDTGPYLLYALARINGIKEKAGELSRNLKSEKLDTSLLTEDSAWQVLLQIADFQKTLERVVEENDPFYLAQYSLDLAKLFSKAYGELKVSGEEKDLAEARLALFNTTGQVLETCLQMLGMQTLERM